MTDACLCEHPLVGFKFGMGLRCRLCNKQLDLAAFERSRTADQKQADAQVVALQDEVLSLRATLAESEGYNAKLTASLLEVEQTLGKALGFPLYADDPANFPGATESDGVCIGDHTAETIAQEAARVIGGKSNTEAADAMERR